MKNLLKWSGLAYALLAIVSATLSCFSITSSPHEGFGFGTVVNFLFSIIGIAGGLLYCLRRRHWKLLLGAWSGLQILHVAFDPSRLWFYQLPTIFTFSTTTTRTVNGQLDSFQTLGVNAIGFILTFAFILILRYQLHWDKSGSNETPKIAT